MLALPAAVLGVVFSLGLGRLGVSSEHRRKAAVILLGVLAAANLVGVGLVLGSLVAGGSQMTGAQLLASAAVVLLVNVITFALVFWELDSGGPVARARGGHAASRPTSSSRRTRTRSSRGTGWAPALKDYLYIAVTNSIAFSPTDAMPLTHRAKLFMGCRVARRGRDRADRRCPRGQHPARLTAAARPRTARGLTRTSYARHRLLPGRGAWMGLTSNISRKETER